jgi:hypothetical protein
MGIRLTYRMIFADIDIDRDNLACVRHTRAAVTFRTPLTEISIAGCPLNLGVRTRQRAEIIRGTKVIKVEEKLGTGARRRRR